MPTSLAGAFDRLIASVLLTGARRTYPMLRLLPPSWLRPLLIPTARRLRRTLARDALYLSLAALAAVTVLALLTCAAH
jgi:hypothetical protein